MVERGKIKVYNKATKSKGEKSMKKVTKWIALGLASVATCAFAACGNREKNISIIAREAGSGTREAFDTIVTDGEHYLQEKNSEGKKVYNTAQKANFQSKTSAVLSLVESNKYAIGYVSLGSISDSVKVVSVEGIAPLAETVLSGDYKIQRPFVIMTNVTVELTPLAADFMEYLKSSDVKTHVERAGCVYEESSTKTTFVKEGTLPDGKGKKILIKGSTSMEKVITEAAAGYAALYGEKGENLFSIELQGSSVGKEAAKTDTVGNVIGLSSAAVNEEGIASYTLCLDAVAVIVNTQNTDVNDLTLKQLYDIFSGKIVKFSEISK